MTMTTSHATLIGFLAFYSVLSRRFAAVATDAVAGFCLATAALACIFHLLFEQTRCRRRRQWLAVAAPLLSTAYLVLAGYAELSKSLAVATALVAGDGLLAVKDMVGRGTRARVSSPLAPVRMC